MIKVEVDHSYGPDRQSPHGVIPDDLPSVYDAVNGSHGLPNLIRGPLIRHFDNYRDEWESLPDEPTSANSVNEPIQKFFNTYVEEEANNADWEEVYEMISLRCAQGWIREAADLGEVGVVNVFTIVDYSNALTEHLKAAEERWGVEWLTSNRPFEGQNDRMIDPMRKYWDGYQSGEMSGKDFFLNLAGDALINLIRLKVSASSLYAWRDSADHFVERSQQS